MVALYKGMNWVVKKEVAAPEVAPEAEDKQLGSKSVLWANPTAISPEESVDKMDWKAYLEYLKRNMWQLGLE
jgi:hypothetical protein